MTKPIKNKKAIITSPYGKRTLKGKEENHGGIDIAVQGNPRCPVYATCDGTITTIITDPKASCGIAVFIKPQDKDYYCLYFHLEFVNPDLLYGDKVKEGDYLGTMGNTGHSFGVHLHYGHRKGMASGTECYDPKEVSSLYTTG